MPPSAAKSMTMSAPSAVLPDQEVPARGVAACFSGLSRGAARMGAAIRTTKVTTGIERIMACLRRTMVYHVPPKGRSSTVRWAKSDIMTKIGDELEAAMQIPILIEKLPGG